jgi:hypothetical protein
MSIENGPSPEDIHERIRRENDEKERSQRSAEDVYAEAHLVNDRYGDKIKNIGTAKEISELVGDKVKANQFEADQHKLMNEAAETETAKVNEILIAAAKMNVDASVLTAFPAWKPIHEYLTTDNTLIGSNNEGDLEVGDLEHIAGKLGGKLQYIDEKLPDNTTMSYPVVKMSETSSDITFITIGTGVMQDGKARLLKISKDTVNRKNEYSIRDMDHKSIYPKTKEASEA